MWHTDAKDVDVRARRIKGKECAEAQPESRGGKHGAAAGFEKEDRQWQ